MDLEKWDFWKVALCIDLCPRICPCLPLLQNLPSRIFSHAESFSRSTVSGQWHFYKWIHHCGCSVCLRSLPVLWRPFRIEKTVQYFVQALRMAPDHEKACVTCRNDKARKAKRDGKKALKEGNCKLAQEQSTEVLRTDPNTIKTNAKFYCNRYGSFQAQRTRWCNRRLHRCRETWWHMCESL